MKNFATSLVVTAPSPATSGLSCTVTSGTGSLFQQGRAVLSPNGSPTTSNAEIVQIDSVSGDTLTLSGRALESTTARSVANGWTISQGLSAGEYNDTVAALYAASLRVSSLVGGMAIIATDTVFGITGNGTTDDRAAIQALLDAAAAANIPEVYFPPGNYLLNSVSVSNGANGSTPNTPATLTFGLMVPPTVSVRGAGSGRTKFTMGVNGNVFMVRSTITSEATITANYAQGAKTFTVSTTTGFAVGDTVATRGAQNPSDAAEARWTVFATITAIDTGAGTITLDTPAEWAMDTSTSTAVNRKLMKVTKVAEKMKFEGFHIEGGADTRHGIGVFWGRQIQWKDITGSNVGSGLVNAQWIDNCSLRDIYVYRCGAYSNTSKGRGISLSNVTNVSIDNFSTDYMEAASIYIESYSRNVRINGWRINNRASTRATNYLIFSGVGCEMFSNGLIVTGWNPANTAANQDSIFSFGPSDGRVQFHNTTLYMQLNQIRSFPLFAATGYFRCFDNSGVMRTFNMNKIETTPLQITLTDGATKTAWMPDGLVVAYAAEVPPGVTSAQLTTFSLAKIGIGSQAIAWVADKNIRGNGWCGDGVYPLFSKWDQRLRVQAIAAASAGVTGTILNVKVYTVAPDDWVSTVTEPSTGTVQAGAFGPNYAV